MNHLQKIHIKETNKPQIKNLKEDKIKAKIFFQVSTILLTSTKSHLNCVELEKANNFLTNPNPVKGGSSNFILLFSKRKIAHSERPGEKVSERKLKTNNLDDLYTF